MEPIILASASPRRQDFFRLMGLPFTCIPATIDETPPPNLTPRQVAENLALKKALSVAEHHPVAPPIPDPSFPIPQSPVPSPQSPTWVFAADTIVVLSNEIFGKPTDREAARQMLEQLSGKRHEVITAIALYNRQTERADCRSVSCAVEFALLSAAEIEWYLGTGEWQGAAGAYRLQELGGCLIKAINGSPSAVAGLPLYDFYVMLRDNGYQFGA
jgi:septum formation protein